jgi:predicted CXXCH cytochrome family protein
MLAMLLATPALAADKAPRPTKPVDPRSCVTAECHADVKQRQVLHGPVNVNACEACHTSVDPIKHTFKPTREGGALCTFCHEITIPQGAVVHKPLTEGQCVSCHDPHGGFDTTFVRGKTMNKLCATCHDDVSAGKKSVHGPVASGACGACHAPHTASKPKLLVAEGRDLCLSCHQEMRTQLDQVKFGHKPVQEACTACHNPHASDHPMMTRSAPGQLCTDSCHAEVKQAATQAKFPHTAVMQDNGCAHCHTAHGGDLAKLMRDRPDKLCLTCHADPVKTTAGRTVAAIAEIANPDLVKHGPITDGSCAGCHTVHGGELSRLLQKPYPETFYESFAVEKYDLCFECHDRQLVLLPKTKGLTNFRDGDVNLHYAHVNKDKRGRSCRACHSTHASTNPLHIRESVPYGNWQLPINYEATENGGTCAPGCHQPLGYDRVKPVSSAIAVKPAASPTTAAAPAAPAVSPAPAKSQGSQP